MSDENWRDNPNIDLGDDSDDDEELEQTPPDVIEVLGFDPLDLHKNSVDRPMKYSQQWNEDKHPRGQPENKGEFVKKDKEQNGGGSNDESDNADNKKSMLGNLIQQVKSGFMTRTQGRKAVDKEGLDKATFIAATQQQPQLPPTPEEIQARKAENERQMERLNALTATAPEHLKEWLPDAIGNSDDGDTDADIIARADSYYEEAEKQKGEDENRMEADKEDLARYEKRESAFDTKESEILDTVTSIPGWTFSQHEAAGGSRYIEADKEMPDDDIETLKIRISDHYAPAGAGFNQETQGRFDEPDVNFVYDVNANEWTIDMEWNPDVTDLKSALEKAAKGNWQHPKRRRNND